MEGYTKCKICGKSLKAVNAAHLNTHSMTVREYNKKYGTRSNYFLKTLKKYILIVIIFFKDFLKDIFMDQIKPFFQSFYNKFLKVIGRLGSYKINIVIAVVGISIASRIVIFKLNQGKLPLSPILPECEILVENPSMVTPNEMDVDTVKNIILESPRPLRPEIPIESESQSIPDDIALDTTKIVFLEIPPPPLPPEEEDAASFFVPYDDPPEPVGGFAAIQSKLVYPEIARKAGIEGTVTVQAKISARGEVVDTRILVPLGNSGCNEAAIAAIKSVKWRPAKQRDKPIAVWVSIPVRFKLK